MIDFIFSLLSSFLGCCPPTSFSKPFYSVSQIRTSERRRIGSARRTSSTRSDDTVHSGRVELDSHADTLVFGRNFVILNYSGRECDVSPYSSTYDDIKGVPVVTAATAWTDQESAETWILVFHEGLWMPDAVEHSLLNPNQLRAFGTHVNDNAFDGSPVFLTDPDRDMVIPFHTYGVNLGFETRTPTQDELENCRKVVLTSPHPWDPQTVRFPRPTRTVEEEMARIGSVKISSHSVAFEEAETSSADLIFNIDDFNRRIISSCKVMSVPTVKEASQSEKVPKPRRSRKRKEAADVSRVALGDKPTPNTFVSTERHSDVTPQDLAERWLIGLAQAAETLKHTTQRMVRSALLPLGRRLKADRIFERHRLRGDWYSDTVFGPVKSKDGNTCGQIFANGAYFATFYPMDSKSKAGDALRVFCNEFGVPDRLIVDGAQEQVGKRTEFQKQVTKHNIDLHISEPGRHNQSPSEGVTREMKRKWYRIMFKKRVPKQLWDYGFRWVCETMQRTYLRQNRIDGGVPLQKVLGEAVDISEYLDFGFYDRVWYRENAGLGEEKLGRWLGVAHHVGAHMCYWVMAENGSVLPRSTVWRVTNLESETDENVARFKRYDQEISRRFKNDDMPIDGDKPDPEQWADMLDKDEDFRDEFHRVYGDAAIKEADSSKVSFTPDILDDTYVNMELALPRDAEGPTYAKVKKRVKDNDGNPVGVANSNPILDTRLFEVEFADGFTSEMTANAIAQNLFAQVDAEGHRMVLLDEIVDYRTTKKAVKQADAFVKSSNGTKRRKETTQGWELLIRWKDGSETWTPLKDMKESYPVQTAEYAVQSRINQEPAFAWWVPYVLKKRNRIIAKTKSKYWERTHKFGIRIPKTVKEALAIDKENQNTLWWDAICQEMKNVRIAFEEFEGEVKDLPPGYTVIDCHMIFDVKLGENYRRKARMVAGGHQTSAPATITYSSVVSRDSVRIALLVAALNDLDILACDIQNAFLTAPCREKIATIVGPEFGSDEGKVMLVRRALYGLKSSSASFRAFLGECLYGMGFKPSQADPDVWMRTAVKPNGFKYYSVRVRPELRRRLTGYFS